MNIVFCTSECRPYASTGGLADVASSLPIALAQNGHTVYRIMPLYRPMLDSIKDYPVVEEYISIPVGLRNLHGSILKHTEHGVTTFFIRRDEYFDRSELYATPQRAYDDNSDRFIFFQKACIELLDRMSLDADIVHCNDWQTGLIPLYIKFGIRGQGRAGKEKSVFTIHNLAYQGVYAASDFPVTSLPFSCFTMSIMEYYGNMSFLKAGITSCDAITTVSETYAKEIQTPELGFGLDGVLAERNQAVHGIVNGVDYDLWNPETDPMIDFRYSVDDLTGKVNNKTALRKRVGLEQTQSSLLLGMVVRLVDQKGLDILEKAMPELMQRNVQFALLGSGQEKYEALVKKWNQEYRGQFSGTIGFVPELAHQIEAGSDAYCMPSRFEPCGLNQLYSLKYGTVPIVFNTGGLADTVEQVDRAGTAGTGYKFHEYSADAFLAAVDQALEHYKDPKIWATIQKRGMKKDFSWDASAQKYEEIYTGLTAMHHH